MLQFQTETMEGGFEQPVFDAQCTFKSIMDAMARPGTIVEFPLRAVAPHPVFRTSAAVMLTLLDNDTSVWLDRSIAPNSLIDKWLAFHTGAPIAEQYDEAQFGFAADFASLPDLTTFVQGSQEYPDRSTTLLVQVETLVEENQLVLTGPGIKHQNYVSIGDIPRDFLNQWNLNNQRFPRGVDIIFASRSSIVCLPRTTKIAKGAV